MAVYRIEKSQNYTCMSNHHLRDEHLSLKAKGLLSVILSLPDDWEYTIQGLCTICHTGESCISSTLKELERQGYILRRRCRNSKGQVGKMEYLILEIPRTAEEPDQVPPSQEQPELDYPELDFPVLDNPALLSKDLPSTEQPNTELQNTESQNTDLSLESIHPSLPFLSSDRDSDRSDEKRDAEADEINRSVIKENIEYTHLILYRGVDPERLDRLVELIVEVLGSRKKYIHIAGEERRTELVKARFYALTIDHIEFLFDSLDQTTTKIRNMKQYLLTALYNVDLVMDESYKNSVRHDLYRNTP